MFRTKQLFYIVVVCMALLILNGISSYATNLVPQHSFEGWTVGSIYTTETMIDSWRFYANEASGGSMEFVSDAEDGSVAVKLSRTSTDGGMSFGLWNTTDHHAKLVNVTPGKRYIVRFWVRSDESDTMKFGIASFGNSEGADFIGNTIDVSSIATHPKWSIYQTTYVAPEGAYHCDLQFSPQGIGSIIIDNLSIEEEDTVPGQNMFPDPTFTSFSTDETFTGETKVGSFRFFAYTDFGSLTAVDPGYDGTGDTAVKFTLNVNAGSWSGHDCGFGLSAQPSCPLNSNMPVIVGHTYRYTFWAKSNHDIAAPPEGAEYVRTYCSAYSAYSTYVGNDSMWLGDQNDGWEVPLDDTWHMYTKTYTPPANTLFVGFAFRQRRVGALLIDNVSFVDVTSFTISGTVTNSLDGSPISGATVKLTGDQTYTATTDANGAYTLTVIRGSYNMAVTASEYASRAASAINVLSATSKNVSMMPDPAPSWNIYDTFTRDDNNTDLGTTEDAYAVPWVKNTNGNVAISGNTLYASNTGTSNNGVFLGRDLTPTDFDVTVDATINEYTYSQWFGISYREDTMGTADDGYIVQVWPWYHEGNIYPVVNLWCNKALVLSDINVSNYINLSTANTLRLKVEGASHQFWLNGNLIFDIEDSTKMNGGYLGLFSDKLNIIAWDNFNASYTEFVPDLTGSVADIRKSADNTKIEVTEGVVTGVYNGSLYIEDANRAAGIKVTSAGTLAEGTRVTNLTGRTMTDANGERYIRALHMTVNSGDPLTALGVSNKAATNSLTQGLLVKTWGKVTYVADDKSYFYIDDGSNIQDGTGNTGIRVDLSNALIARLTAIFVDEQVAVTGVMGRTTDGSSSIIVIRPESTLSIRNTVINNVTVTPSDTSWILQSASGAGSITFASVPDTLYGSGGVLMSEGSDGSADVINLRTTNHAGLKIADITELSISNYMTNINATGAKGIGVRISVNLDDIPDNSNYGGDVDDILTCDPYYNPYTYALCKQNGWVTFDALNTGYWYSSEQLDGSSDAGPWKTLKDYLSLYPDAKIANYSIGGLRFFMGGCTPHWDNVTGFIDNICVGTKDGMTVYNFEQ